MKISRAYFAFVCVGFLTSMYGCSGQDDVAKVPPPVASSNNSPSKMEFSTEINAKDLVGSWAAGGGHASIEELPDGSFKVTTEKHPTVKNQVTTGTISGDRLECKAWKISARLSQDKKTLLWSNNFPWTK